MLRAFKTAIPRARAHRASALAQTHQVKFARFLATDTFLQSNSSNYVEEMYEAWRQDPSSVHVSWNAYFKNLDGGAPASAAYSAPPTLVP
ncbi:hypothetical protein OXX80_007862, partial [Metschnikowia pulcherrima]